MNGFYWIYLVLLVFMLVSTFTDKQEQKRLLYYMAWSFLFLIFVVQDFSVSIDAAEYMRQFAVIPELSLMEMLNHKFEIGYVVMCWLVERVFESDRVLLLLLGCLILVPFSHSFEKETENPMIAVMAFAALGMYLHALIYWRQLAAMAILTYSYRYIRQRRLVPFLLVVLAAMSFHKASVVMVGLYLVYRIPINKWLLLGSAATSAVLGILGKPIIEFGIALIYPRYTHLPRLVIGGETLLLLLWAVVLLAYWMFQDRMDEGRIRLPFLMILIAAVIQPICFAFYNWLRIVLFFRIALVPMTAILYTEMFERKENNKMLMLLERCAPGLHKTVLSVYDKKCSRAVAQVLLFAFLFVWYVSELDGARYLMAPFA